MVGAVVGVALGAVSLVATYQSSDVLHYITAVAYLASPFFAHLPASRLSGTKCSIKEGVFLYLAVAFIVWIAAFNVVYAALSKP